MFCNCKILCSHIGVHGFVNTCILLQVIVKYNSGVRAYTIDTPTQRRTIKQVIQRCYAAVASRLVQGSSLENVLTSLGRQIRAELRQLCLLENNSILRDTISAVKCFSWEQLLAEFQTKLPTLVKFFRRVFPHCSHKVLCFIISQLVKQRSPQMALAQRVISVLMYGNSASKQVCS